MTWTSIFAAARGRVDPSKGTAALAAQFVTPRPLVAKRHSFTTGSLRYFEVRFIGPSEFASVIQQPRTTGDGQILILLPDASAPGESTDDLARDPRLRDRPDLLVVTPAETRSLEDILHELASLEWMRGNTPELEGDATARRELRARIAAQRRSLDEILTPILAPGDSDGPVSTWFHRGQKQRIASRRGLQDYLSHLCDDTYTSAPHIRNELINRRELSSAAAAARRNLIEAMIEHGDQLDLGIVGTPPEKSMYLSVLRQTGIHRKTGDCWHFSALPALRMRAHAKSGLRSPSTSPRANGKRDQSQLYMSGSLLLHTVCSPVQCRFCSAPLCSPTTPALHSTKRGHL